MYDSVKLVKHIKTIGFPKIYNVPNDGKSYYRLEHMATGKVSLGYYTSLEAAQKMLDSQKKHK